MDLRPDLIRTLPNIRTHFFYNLKDNTLGVFQKMAGLVLEYKPAGDNFRPVDDNPGFFIYDHIHDNNAVFGQIAPFL